ncbi:MAG: undecaprenyl-diphosphate phosphatase [Lentisphaerae bacterium]|nr:undecaprenyl-diphosphate phosphatase [Lentisphaerota bacterium]
MLEVLKVAAMGVLQGVTEFLPVSSSGHLVLAKHFFGIKSSGPSLEIFLHSGTLVTIIIFYRRKLWDLITGIFQLERMSILYALWVLFSMVPVFILHIFTGNVLVKSYGSPIIVASMLCLTGVFLLSSIFINNNKDKERPFTWQDSMIMSLAQALALLPGISRSGITIYSGRLAGVKPEDAAEFSFIMSLPVMFGAIILDLLKGGPGDVSMPACFTGAIVAALTGCISISALIKILNSGKLWVFGIYCLVAGIISSLLIYLL